MTTRDKLQFVHAMARSTRATVRQCEALLRYAGTLSDLAEQERNDAMSDDEHNAWAAKRERIRRKVTELCGEIAGITDTERYDVVRDGSTLVCRVEFAEAQDTRDSMLEHTPGIDCRIIGAVCVPVFAGPALKIRTPGGEEIVCPS